MSLVVLRWRVVQGDFCLAACCCWFIVEPEAAHDQPQHFGY
jgi:hypothetical protein